MLTLLVLGESDSAGQGLADTSDAWPNQVRLGLTALTGREIRLVHRQLAIHPPNAVEFAMKCVAESRADLVILPLSTHSFSIQRVSLKARDRFGVRGERFCARLEARFRRIPGIGRAGSLPDRAGRALGRLVIGARPYATYENTSAAYKEIIRRLAAAESLGVLVTGATCQGRALQDLDPSLTGMTARFNAAMRPVALQHRFAWLDREAVFVAAPNREAAYQPDGIHKSPYGHALLGQAMAGAMADLPAFAPVPAGR
jgi:lysophospholipase L1-like esterase